MNSLGKQIKLKLPSALSYFLVECKIADLHKVILTKYYKSYMVVLTKYYKQP